MPLGATVVWPQNQAICGLRPRHLGPKGAEKIHATLRAAGFNASLGATVVWPQNQAICGLRPRHLGRKGSKKHSCNPVGCEIWRALGSDGRLASRPGKLRAAPAAPWPKGSKKTFMQPCGLRDLARPWERLSFGLKAGRVAGYARGTLAERGLKNIHATLWAAGFGTSSGATVVWPQSRASCGLYPRHLGPKGSKKQSCSPADCENGHVLGGYGRLASRPDKLRAAPAEP